MIKQSDSGNIQTMSHSKITYLKGDATKPSSLGNKIIIHCCNNKGKWGAGFVLALSRKWPRTKTTYLQNSLELGTISLLQVEKEIYVANVIGQDGYGRRGRYVKYEALRKGLGKVAIFATSNKASIHGPRLGSGLAGGEWTIIEAILEDVFIKDGINVTIYDL